MKEIVLKISGKTLSTMPKQEHVEEPIEFITEGKISQRGNITYLSYEETPLSGMEGCTTHITITPGKLKMRREGEAIGKETVMEFEEGKRYNGLYSTPFGDVDMEILTNSIKINDELAGDRKKYSVEYDISLKGLMEAKKSFDIEVNPKYTN